MRTARLGLDKRARQADRLGVGDKPEAQQVQERARLLRNYRWSSYRASEGLEQAPEWLTTAAVLELGGRGAARERQAAYDRYVENEIRHGDWGRELALFLGRSACGLPLRSLGEVAGGLNEAAVNMAIQRFTGRLAREKPLRQTVESAK